MCKGCVCKPLHFFLPNIMDIPPNNCYMSKKLHLMNYS